MTTHALPEEVNQDYAALCLKYADLTSERDELARKYEAATSYSRLTQDRCEGLENQVREWSQVREAQLTVKTALIAERDALTARNTELAAENVRLNTERGRWLGERNDARDALAVFKEKVQEVGYRYADKHDWCEVMDEAMEELGLKRDPITYQDTLSITVEFHATLNRTSGELPERHWVRESLNTSDIRDAIEGSLRGDSDHEELDVDTVEFRVSDIADNS